MRKNLHTNKIDKLVLPDAPSRDDEHARQDHREITGSHIHNGSSFQNVTDEHSLIQIRRRMKQLQKVLLQIWRMKRCGASERRRIRVYIGEKGRAKTQHGCEGGRRNTWMMGWVIADVAKWASLTRGIIKWDPHGCQHMVEGVSGYQLITIGSQPLHAWDLDALLLLHVIILFNSPFFLLLLLVLLF